MIDLIKNIAIFFSSVIVIGIFMKLANYIGEHIGIYKMLQHLWKKISKDK